MLSAITKYSKFTLSSSRLSLGISHVYARATCFSAETYALGPSSARGFTAVEFFWVNGYKKRMLFLLEVVFRERGRLNP